MFAFIGDGVPSLKAFKPLKVSESTIKVRESHPHDQVWVDDIRLNNPEALENISGEEGKLS